MTIPQYVMTASTTGREGSSFLRCWRNRYNSRRWQWSRKSSRRKPLVIITALCGLGVVVPFAFLLFPLGAYALLQSTRGTTARRRKDLDPVQLEVRDRAMNITYKVLANLIALAAFLPTSHFQICVTIATIGFLVSIGTAAWVLPAEADGEVILMGRHTSAA